MFRLPQHNGPRRERASETRRCRLCSFSGGWHNRATEHKTQLDGRFLRALCDGVLETPSFPQPLFGWRGQSRERVLVTPQSRSRGQPAPEIPGAPLHSRCTWGALPVPSVWECNGVSCQVVGAVPNAASDCGRCSGGRPAGRKTREAAVPRPTKGRMGHFCARMRHLCLFVCVHPWFFLTRGKRLS